MFRGTGDAAKLVLGNFICCKLNPDLDALKYTSVQPYSRAAAPYSLFPRLRGEHTRWFYNQTPSLLLFGDRKSM